MNYLWAFMILTGVVFAAFHKRGGNTLYYHDGSDVFLGWTDENR